MRIHKEGKKIVIINTIICIAIILILLLTTNFHFIACFFSFLALLWAIETIWFFRDPGRVAQKHSGTIIAPADGKVVIIQEVEETEYLKKRVLQVSIFMSIFDVHVNWYPLGGAVSYYKYHPGKYLVAWHPKSSEENERSTIVVKSDTGVEVLFRQIAGLIAKRIVTYAENDKTFDQGDQCGFIKFGSRIDLFLPLGSEIFVKKGDKVTGCKTIIANLPNSNKSKNNINQ